jgi:hypothetical protein
VLALWGDRARVRWHLITGGIKSATSVRVRDLERFD